jgi:two-component system, LytTR family, response regulator
MKTLIIEDESLTARRLETLLKKYDPDIEVLAVIPSVQGAIQWFRANQSPDLAFMDIHLEDDLAFKIFDEARIQTPVIFTTAYDEYTIQAFKVNSIDYLLKPINYDELAQALDKFKNLKEQFSQPNLERLLQYIENKEKEPEYKSRFMIAVGTKIRSYETSEIAYFYSADKLTFMVTKDNQRLPVDYSLDKLANLLNPRDFFRISRQYLVSFPAIQTVYAHYKGKLKLDLAPKSQEEVFVSGDRMTDFKAWLGR